MSSEFRFPHPPSLLIILSESPALLAISCIIVFVKLSPILSTKICSHDVGMWAVDTIHWNALGKRRTIDGLASERLSAHNRNYSLFEMWMQMRMAEGNASCSAHARNNSRKTREPNSMTITIMKPKSTMFIIDSTQWWIWLLSIRHTTRSKCGVQILTQRRWRIVSWILRTPNSHSGLIVSLSNLGTHHSPKLLYRDFGSN